MTKAEIEKMEIEQSEEYKRYIEALSNRAKTWIPKIAVQYAIKAFELYQNPTVRKVVLAYGEECKKAEKEYLYQFRRRSIDTDHTFYNLEHSCMIHDKEYGQTIDLLFGINLDLEA